ncbi:MAG: HDIG domain-containing metalloprotein [Chloroflexota bacterium]
MTGNARQAKPTQRAALWAIVLLLAVSVAAFIALILTLPSQPDNVPAQAGEVAQQSIQAPRTVEYVSQILTERARQAAENQVAPVYAPPDPAVARVQIEHLRSALQYITIIRNDAYAGPDQKLADLSAMQDLHLDDETATTLLGLPQNRWDILQQETLSVLEQVMRSSIRQDALETVRRSIPTLVSLALSEDQARLVADLVAAFVAPNSFFSPELTDLARQSAREAVEPVTQTFIQGETIVQSGEVVTDFHIEALTELGLVQPPENPQNGYLGASALVMVASGFAWMYFLRRRPALLSNLRSLVIIALLFLAFLVGARLLANRSVMPYIYPLPAFGLLMGVLFGQELGLVLSLILAVLAGYGVTNSLDLTLFYLFSALTSVLALGRARRVAHFFRAGMAIAVTGFAMVLAYRWPFGNTDLRALVELGAAAIFNGIAATSITLLLQYLLAQFLGLVTPLQLLEISRPDFPLLQFFLSNAPGTYQHSLQVANLAEQAAERIGADPLLTRVGALFHDVGKAANASFFIENQVPGSINTHDDIQPAESAAAIIRHVTDGVDLARKYRLPGRITDFMLEHHGSLITRYQYRKAIDLAGGDPSSVDLDQFRYPGPTPRSRETALLMLADGVEARARAEQPKDEEELKVLIHNVIEIAQREGQLDNAPLTLRDLRVVTESFVTTLRNTYHPRIQYPKTLPGEAKPAAEDTPTTPNPLR